MDYNWQNMNNEFNPDPGREVKPKPKAKFAPISIPKYEKSHGASTIKTTTYPPTTSQIKSLKQFDEVSANNKKNQFQQVNNKPNLEQHNTYKIIEKIFRPEGVKYSLSEELTADLIVIPVFTCSYLLIKKDFFAQYNFIIKNSFAIASSSIISVSSLYYMQHPAKIIDHTSNIANYFIFETPELLPAVGYKLRDAVTHQGLKGFITKISMLPVVIKYSLYLGQYVLEKSAELIKHNADSVVDYFGYYNFKISELLGKNSNLENNEDHPSTD